MRAHIDPKPSKIVSRFRFSQCHRRPSQPIADFVAELRRAAEHCEFGATLEDRLMEQLVCGIADERMQRHLLAEDKLDFNKAQRLSLALEMSSKDAQLISGQSTTPNSGVSAVHATSSRPAVQADAQRCWRCDRPNHSPDICRFRNLKCHNCSLYGHVSRACKRRRKPSSSASGTQRGSRRLPAKITSPPSPGMKTTGTAGPRHQSARSTGSQPTPTTPASVRWVLVHQLPAASNSSVRR